MSFSWVISVSGNWPENLNYYQEDDGRDTEVDFLSVTGENLYDRDTENILFPNIS